MATNDHRAGVPRGAAEITERVAIGGFMAGYTGVEAAVAPGLLTLDAGGWPTAERQEVRPATPVDSVSCTGSPYPV